MRVEQAGPHRVAVTGTRGSPPPGTLKVALNMLGGYRNTMTMVITGLDIEAKAEQATNLLFGLLGGAEAFEEADVRLLRFDRPDAPTSEQATAHLPITGQEVRQLVAVDTEVGRLGEQLLEPQLRRARPARARGIRDGPARRPGEGSGRIPPFQGPDGPATPNRVVRKRTSAVRGAAGYQWDSS